MTWNTQPDPINTVGGSGELDLSAGTVLATGSITPRTTADRAADVYNVKDWGLVGDGVTNDAPAFQNLINTAQQNAHIIFPEGSYLFEAGFTFYPNTTLTMQRGGSIIKAVNDDLFTINTQYLKFEDLVIDLQGDVYTGAAMRFVANSSYIEVSGGRYEDGADSIFLFEDSGGQRTNLHDFFYNIHVSLADGGAAAVKRTVSTVDTTQAPRHFHHITSGAFSWFAIVDGFATAYFDHIYCAGITLGDNSLGNTINNCRLAVKAGLTAHISGNSTLVSMNEIGGDLTIDAGFVYGQFVNNQMNPSKTFTDNSIKTFGQNTPRVHNPILVIGAEAIVMATANLPTAGATMDGRILIEDAGAGDRNLIVYAGGQRFRIDGGAAF